MVAERGRRPPPSSPHRTPHEHAPGARPGGLLGSVDWGRVPFGTILATVGIVVAVYLAGKILYRLRDVVVLLVVSGFIALLLDPLVVALERHGVPRRGLAVAIVTLFSVVVFAGLGFAFGYPLANGLIHLARALPDYVRQAQQGHGWIGHLVQRYHVEAWVRENAPKLISFAESLTKPILSIGKGAATVLVSLLVLVVLVVLLLLEAPKMRTAVLASLSPASAARWRRLGAAVSHSVAAYMLGDFATSLLAGVVMLVTLVALSVPFALLWALWVALVDFLPEVGGALAGIPTVLFAFTHSLSAGIVTGAVFLAYWQLENRILNPIVMSRTVRINPLLVFVSVIVAAGLGSWVGGVFGGFAAALIAIPAAASGQTVVRELRRGGHGEAPSAQPDAAEDGTQGGGLEPPGS